MIFVRSLVVILLIMVATVLGCNRSPSQGTPSEPSLSENVGRGEQESSLASSPQPAPPPTVASPSPSSPVEEGPSSNSSKEPDGSSATPPEDAPSVVASMDEQPLLLLDEEETENKKANLAADNSRCLVCHLNYELEEIARIHAKEGYGCAYCHGQSDAHIADESWASGGNGTAPDIIYRPAEVTPACLKCHELSKSDPECRCEFPRLEEKKLCTDCHGSHRLKSRKCHWK